jgi:phenylpyruvate tautomerase PptA (4-oxalocrotonate tautomerase family)
MPHWLVYHPPNAYTDDESRDALVKEITAFYVNVGMPAFYVVVNFIEVPLNGFYIGAKKRGPEDTPFIRFVATHIAHNYPQDDAIIRAAGDTFNKLLTPLLKGKGYDWEFHITESDRRLWKVNEFTPPERRTEGEALWVKENRPVPY